MFLSMNPQNVFIHIKLSIYILNIHYLVFLVLFRLKTNIIGILSFLGRME